MAFYRKSGGANVAITTVKYKSGGVWRAASTVKKRSGGGWITVWSATPLSITATSVNGTFSSATAGSKTIGTSTATAAGGSGSYSYTCVRLSGTPLATASGLGNIRSFRVNVSNAGLSPGDANEVWRWTVNDGNTAASFDITVKATDTN